MQFNIRDILLITSVAVLAIVAFVAHSKTKQLSIQINDVREDSKSLKNSVSAIESNLALSKSDQKLDFIRQVQIATEHATAGFEKVRERYGKVEPESAVRMWMTNAVPVEQNDEIVIREVPEYHQTLKTSITHWRINVPSGKPVYLRSGIGRNVDYRFGSYDTVDWLTDTPFLDSNPYQIQLESGINDLRILTTSSGLKVELQLGDQRLLVTKFDGKHSDLNESNRSARHPLAFSLGKIDSVSGRANLDYYQDLKKISFSDTTTDYEFWIWLSSNPNVEGFETFPVAAVSVPQEQTPSEVTSDE